MEPWNKRSCYLQNINADTEITFEIRNNICCVQICHQAQDTPQSLFLVDCHGLKWGFNWLYILSYLSTPTTTVTCLTQICSIFLLVL